MSKGFYVFKTPPVVLYRGKKVEVKHNPYTLTNNYPFSKIFAVLQKHLFFNLTTVPDCHCF